MVHCNLPRAESGLDRLYLRQDRRHIISLKLATLSAGLLQVGDVAVWCGVDVPPRMEQMKKLVSLQPRLERKHVLAKKILFFWPHVNVHRLLSLRMVYRPEWTRKHYEMIQLTQV